MNDDVLSPVSQGTMMCVSRSSGDVFVSHYHPFAVMFLSPASGDVIVSRSGDVFVSHLGCQMDVFAVMSLSPAIGHGHLTQRRIEG